MSVWHAIYGRRDKASQVEGLSDDLRLALQTALIGQITPAMRLISVEQDEAAVRVVVFFDKALADEDRTEFEDEVASCVGLKVGDPPAGPAVACFFVRCDEPQRVPVRGEIVFSRKGVSAF
ncbi:MAG: hypothetical protein M3552_09750 [Planctomycetota bacterium]|nr:hypothetical protein [Planctomycetaceae bacterium]MDQ3330922.1 hypothetical protein [Planctomycetota bacterium]